MVTFQPDEREAEPGGPIETALLLGVRDEPSLESTQLRWQVCLHASDIVQVESGAIYLENLGGALFLTTKGPQPETPPGETRGPIGWMKWIGEHGRRSFQIQLAISGVGFDRVCNLAEKYGALVMVDDSHAVGFMGKTGRGTHEYHKVMGRVDVITGTLGKALGGASGGYTSGRREIIELLRQRSRPYLFSNTLAPIIAGATLKVLELLTKSTALRDKLEANTKFFRDEMTKRGFNILPGAHPIAPIMLGDAALATKFADAMLARGVYVIGFSYPVVPKGKARIRTQISAAHSREELEHAIEAFTAVKQELGI